MISPRTLSVLLLAMPVLGSSTASAQPTPAEPAPAEPAPAVPAPATPAPTAPAASTVEGEVLDAATGEAIPGATITVDGDDASNTTSDGLGRFKITARVGQPLIVEAPGYELALVGVETLTGMRIALVSVKTTAELIEVTGTPPPSAPGAAKLYREELATLPGTGGDILASLDILPGVTTAPGGFGGGQGVIIRGSAPEDSRILLDGFDIPQLYHLFGRSIIPTEAVDGLEYLPGGFDVKFGRASSGIVSITSRGGEDKLHGVADVSIIDAGVVGSGPVGDKGHVLASFRRSYVDTWLPSVLPDSIGLVAAPRFYDGLLRVDYDLGDRWKTALTVVGSDDATELIGSDDQSDDDFQFSLGTRFLRTIAAANWRGNHGLSVDNGVSFLAQEISFKFSNGADSQFLNIQQLSFAARSEATKTLDSLAGLTKVVLRAGAEVDTRRNNVDLSLQQGPDEGEARDGRDGATISFNNRVWLNDLAAWTALEGNLSDKLRMTLGLRLDAYIRNRALPIHPRGEISYQADPKTKLRIAAGRYTRPAENNEELLDVNLEPESSTQVMLGAERKLGDRGNVQVTVYDSERTDLITRDQMGGSINQGRGRTYGAELLASYRTPQVFGWLSYSLSRSTRRDRPGAEERLFDFDQTHDLVAAATYKTKNKKWQFGAKFTFRTGQPFTPVLGAVYDSDADTYYRLNGAINSQRIDNHHQLDLRIDRIWNFKDWKFSAFLDVQNVYYNAEMLSLQYNFDYTQSAKVESIPILPSIGIRGEI